MDSNIYNDPELYRLEHAGSSPDAEFLIQFARRHRPARILELGCGEGRLTRPLASAAQEWGGRVSGLDASAPMLERAAEQGGPVEWISGDVRTFQRPGGFDWIFAACSSLSHLTDADDLLTTWKMAAGNLAPGGRFLVVELMADLPALADSMATPPRIPVQFDSERDDGSGHLVRCRATIYHADTQTTDVHYLYDHFEAGQNAAARRLAGYRGHVFFPNEFRLLFMAAGFVVEDIWGDFGGGPLCSRSRHLIGCGRKVESGS